MSSKTYDDLRAALGDRGIRTMLHAEIEPGYLSLSMSTYSVQEFLSAIAPGPVAGDDGLSMRILGRGQDLGPDDDPWRFVAHPTIEGRDSAIQLEVIVSVPESDLAAVVARLRGA